VQVFDISRRSFLPQNIRSSAIEMKPRFWAIALFFSSISSVAFAKTQPHPADLQTSLLQNCKDCGVNPVSPHPISLNLAQRLPNPTISIKKVYYSINGSTATQLRQQMNQLGPIDSNENRHYDATTKWYVRWSYRYSNTNNRCKINSINVSTEVTYTLPKWNPPQTSSALNQQWNRYIKALQVHESGHKDHGIAAGNEVFTTLKNLPSASSCPTLEATANNTARSIIKKYNQLDINYDAVTQHGLTQGARFP
jgi:predicted secreted Zn-dependent protease